MEDRLGVIKKRKKQKPCLNEVPCYPMCIELYPNFILSRKFNVNSIIKTIDPTDE